MLVDVNDTVAFYDFVGTLRVVRTEQGSFLPTMSVATIDLLSNLSYYRWWFN